MTSISNGDREDKPCSNVVINGEFASLPCDIDSVPSILKDIAIMGEGDYSTRCARLELLEKARSLVRALETPRETMLKHVGGQVIALFCLTIGQEAGLFVEMLADNGSAKSVAQLAMQSGMASDLLERMLRHLAAMGYVTQIDSEKYQPTNFTKAMTLPTIGDSYPYRVYSCLKPLLGLHEWLKMNDFKTPTTVKNGPWTFGHQTNRGLFDWLEANQPLASHFNNYMGGFRYGRPSWMDQEVYPVRESLIEGLEGGADGEPPVLLVDIGGGYGHDLIEFQTKYPDPPGRLILQDLPRVLDKINDLPEGIELVPYDFNESQPIQGARAYYMHQILHDYPDDECVKIVERMKEAMKPGYSKLLVNEHIIPAIGANWEATYLDMYMMVLLSSRERSEKDWRCLLEDRCGLRICNFWNPGNGVEGVIECEIQEGLEL